MVKGLLPNSRTAATKVTEGLLAALDDEARKRGLTRSTAMRVALEAWLGDDAVAHERAAVGAKIRERVARESAAIERLPRSSRFARQDRAA